MNQKKYIGQFISIKFTDRSTPISGIVISYNEDWTLMKYNPVDYLMDGYIIIRHKNIEGFRRETTEKFKEKVIKLKQQHLSDIIDFPLTDLEKILSTLTNRKIKIADKGQIDN